MTEDHEYEAALALQQRRRRILTVTVLAVVVVGGVLGYLLWPKVPPARCKTDQVRAFLQDRSLPAETVHLACTLPGPLDRTLRGSFGAPPRMRPVLVPKLVSTSPELFTPVCATFPKALADALAAPPAEQTARFLGQCDLAAAGFASRGDLEAAPLSRVVLAAAVYHALAQSDSRRASRLAQEICCKGRP